MAVLLTSIPKSGTHLAQNTLDLGAKFLPHNSSLKALLYGGLDHDLATGHIYPHPQIVADVKESGQIVIFLHREPKDTIVSWGHHWVTRAPIWSPFCLWKEGDLDWSDPLLWLIENIKPFYDGMMEWTRHATYVITYEQLLNMPHPNVMRVADALRLDHAGVMKRSKEKVTRYRTGKSGNWKYEFQPHHMEAFRRIWE